MPRYKSLQERLSHNSKKVGECVVWTGYCQSTYVTEPGTAGAYGRINLTKGGRSLKFPVHRVSKVLEEIIIQYPAFDFYKLKDKELFFDLYQAYSACGLSIDHLCKNSLCINPAHLEWVHLSNNQQRKKWGRQKREKRMEMLNSKRTRHYINLSLSPSIFAWVKQIQKRSHRIK